MTDAALPVTQRAVEEFVERYLISLGAEIEKEGQQWSVAIPDDANTDLELDGITLEVVRDPEDVGDRSRAIAPESPFVERVLDEAADRAPVGSIALTGDQVEIELPPWITEGPVKISDRTFTPYYDRQALCVLFRVGIETVSEYQREELYAVALDLNDNKERPQLAETYLSLVKEYEEHPGRGTVNQEMIADTLDTACTVLEREIAPLIRKTRKRATRSADVELDEYRQFVQQRRDELTEEIDHLTARIQEVTETIDSTSTQEKRVEALRTRKDLQTERAELRTELEDLTTQIESNFPEKRREIRERHALSVDISPVTATLVSYERGDLDIEFEMDEAAINRSYAYAVGSGILEEASCGQCGEILTAGNPLVIDGDNIIGTDCCFVSS